MAASHAYEYARPALTVDCVVFGLDADTLRVLLVKRGQQPHRGDWALPGGFVRIDETLDDAARRELSEETGVDDVYLEQLYTFGAIERDPRERIVSVAYYALVKLSDHQVRAATDADDAQWFAAAAAPSMPFDHDELLNCAYHRLQNKVRYQPIGFELLPEKFTLSQLQTMYEAILQRPLDKRNFRKKILAMDLLAGLDEYDRDGPHRPAQLFRFDRERYERLTENGFNFEI